MLCSENGESSNSETTSKFRLYNGLDEVVKEFLDNNEAQRYLCHARQTSTRSFEAPDVYCTSR